MKTKDPKDQRISFQEKVGASFQPRAFDTPREHLDFHLSNLRKMPNVIRGIVVTAKQN